MFKYIAESNTPVLKTCKDDIISFLAFKNISLIGEIATPAAIKVNRKDKEKGGAIFNPAFIKNKFRSRLNGYVNTVIIQRRQIYFTVHIAINAKIKSIKTYRQCSVHDFTGTQVK